MAVLPLVFEFYRTKVAREEARYALQAPAIMGSWPCHDGVMSLALG